MTTTPHLIPRLIAVVFFGLARSSCADVVDFDTAGDLSSKFSVNGNPVAFVQSATGGITGGSVDSNVDDYGLMSAIYKTPFSPTAGLRMEVYFKVSLLGGGPYVRLGFVGDPGLSMDYGSTKYMWTEPYNNNRIALVHAGGGTPPIDAFVAPMTVGNWYKLSLAVRPTGGSNFNGTITLQNYGATGTVAGTILYDNNANFANSIAIADSTWYGGFFFQNSTVSNVDNFLVALVPEANPLLLLGIVSAVACVWRAKNHARATSATA